MTRTLRFPLVFLLFCSFAKPALSYSVLTHEQLIDLAWNGILEPLLKKKFPQTTPAGLKQAHAFAYGGCAIQDLGYYPFGNSFFSDLTHYVRSGNFVQQLIRDAQDVDEYAFALGALSHYVGDNIGHHDAVNPATAISFPKLEKKYGPSVTYDENPHAHVRTEFAFDIDELSRHRLAPSAYLRFVGLRVPLRLLSQAFEDTYSLRLQDLWRAEGPAVRSYRASVRSFLPRIAYAETVLHRNQFPDEIADSELTAFLNSIAQADFQTVWNQYRRKPGFKTYVVAFLIRIVPKIGVLSDVAIKIPTQETQQLYIQSVNRSIELFRSLLGQVGEGKLSIPDRDLDTGEKSKPAVYALTDQTYADLLHRITNNGQTRVEEGLRKDILYFYSDLTLPFATKKNRNAWAQVLKDLVVLRAIPAANFPE